MNATFCSLRPWWVRQSAAVMLVAFLLTVTATSPVLAAAILPPQEQSTGEFVVTVNTARLNVRSGPGTNNPVVTGVNAGAQLTVIGQNSAGDWYQVRLADGTTGWVLAVLTGRSSEPSAGTPVAATAQTGSTPTATVRSARINVRSGPGTNYPVVTSLNGGAAVEILALNSGGDWYQVRVSGFEQAWVLAALTSATGAIDSLKRLPPDQIPAAPAAPAPAAPAAGNAPPPAGGGFFAYGIQGQFWETDKGQVVNWIKDLGMSWTKQQVRWEFMENEPGAINWSQTDEIINVVHGNGIQILFSVVTAPQWTRPDKPGTGGPPNDFNLYANFVGQIAARYCGRLQAIEVWNEQNLQREWEGFPLNPASYMDLLRRAYTSIKNSCPSILVISGAPTPTGSSPVAVDDIEYLRGMYANGLARYCDGVGVHPSGYAHPPEVTVQDWQQGRYIPPASHFNHRSFYFRSTMEESRQVMVANGDVNKRLWLTEFGWASTQSPHPGYEYAAYNSEAQQAQYIVNAYNLMRGWGWVGVAFLWNLNYNYSEMAAFSVLNRPAYNALKGLPR